MAGLLSKYAAAKAINMIKGGKKKGNKGCLIGIIAAALILLILIIVVAVISMPFVGLPFYLWLKKEASASGMDITKMEEKIKVDPWSNADFTEELLEAIEMDEDKWAETLATLQSKKMMFPEGDVTLDESYDAVLAGNIEDFIISPPSGQKPLNKLELTQAKNTYDFNQKMIHMQLEPFIGKIVENVPMIISLEPGEQIVDASLDPTTNVLTYSILRADGTKDPQPEIVGVSGYKIFDSDPEEARKQTDPQYSELAEQYAGKMVVSVSEDNGKYGVIGNFPVPNWKKVHDIVSINQLMTEKMQKEGELTLDVELDINESNLGTYIVTEANTPIVASEDVSVMDVIKNDDGTISVIVESISVSTDNEEGTEEKQNKPEAFAKSRRYRYDMLKMEDSAVIKGAVIPKGGIVGVTSDYKSSKGIFQFRTYVDIFQAFGEEEKKLSKGFEDFEANKMSALADPAQTGGFIEVESYKVALVLEKFKIRNESTEDKRILGAVQENDSQEVEEKGGN